MRPNFLAFAGLTTSSERSETFFDKLRITKNIELEFFFCEKESPEWEERNRLEAQVMVIINSLKNFIEKFA